MTPYRSLTLEEFCARIQAREPTPGGGSVSAVAAALGASLGVMAAAFSAGRNPDHTAEVEALSARMLDLAGGFLRLADEDSRAYEGFGAAQKLPKSSEPEKKVRKAAMQEALRKAAEVPLDGMRHAHGLLDLLQRLRPLCSPHLSSDVAVGAWMARAALHGCRLNVQVNLASIQDAGFVDGAGKEAARLAAQGEAIAVDLLADAAAPH